MPLVVLTGAEGVDPIKIDSKYLEISDGLKQYLDNYDSGADEKAFPLPTVPSKSLKLVVEFLKHYTDEDKMITRDELRKKLLNDEFEEWDAKFLADMDSDLLIELACVANFMNLDHLQLICAKKASTLVKGSSTDELRSTFRLTDEWEQEDYEFAKKEMDWLFPKNQ